MEAHAKRFVIIGIRRVQCEAGIHLVALAVVPRNACLTGGQGLADFFIVPFPVAGHILAGNIGNSQAGNHFRRRGLVFLFRRRDMARFQLLSITKLHFGGGAGDL